MIVKHRNKESSGYYFARAALVKVGSEYINIFKRLFPEHRRIHLTVTRALMLLRYLGTAMGPVKQPGSTFELRCS